MRKLVKKHKSHIQNFIAAFVVGGLAYAAFSFGAPNNNGNIQESHIKDTTQFVLIAENSIHISENSQISSGDIATNKSIHVAENNILNSNLFSETVQIGGNTSVNGSTTSNKLIKSETAEIFGEENSEISRPVLELPKIEQFQTGGLSYVIEEDITLDPGIYNLIEVKENAILTLNPGVYNLNSLTLEDNSKLLYGAETTINIKNSAKVLNNVLIASNNPDQEETTDLAINYAGKQPLNIGERALVVAKILSPGSRVQIGSKATFLGKVFAKDIHVGEESVLSRELSFEKESDPEKVIEEQGVRLFANEIVVVLDDGASVNDAQNIASLVGGEIAGFVPHPDTYKILVSSSSFEELLDFISTTKNSNNPLLLEVVPNIIIE